MSVVEKELLARPEISEDAAMASDVALAAIWMDAEYPGWAERIDVATLNIDHCPTCIIGQAASEEDWKRLYRDGRLHEYLRGVSPAWGAAPFSSDDTKSYWLNEIAKRV